ncbi:MAG: chromosomal replication initiator protein DnaA [Candidatus Peregrinibacteria bacterium]
MNQKDLWTRIIKELSKEIERAQILTWFKNTAILSVSEGVMTIGLPLPFFLNWHATHLASATLKAAQAMDPTIQKVAYEIDLNLAETDSRVIDLTAHFPEKAPRKLPNKGEVKIAEGLISKMFNPKYTLENFIVAPENRLAHAACLNVAKYPGQNYNPLFIYGGVGLGKTHLLQGTGQEILRNNPNKIVLYVTSEMFVNDVVRCIQTHNMEKLRAKYRKVDTLLIDDIQFMANKDRSQEEFFHTFNALYDNGKQIIISSDTPPQELHLLSPRLTSRFESGMIVDIKMPDFETRLAILQDLCQRSQVIINEEVLNFIAYNADRSVRMLEGVLKQAIAKYELENTSPTVRMVSEILKHSKKEIKPVGFIQNDLTPRTAITIDRLIEYVSDYFTVPKSDVVGVCRVRECMIPRQVIMYLAKTRLRMSLAKIGQTLGNRNHTTVMHAVNRMSEQLKNDRQLLCDINAIAKEVGIAN